jgi:predicted O-methyltransferase YrrM
MLDEELRWLAERASKARIIVEVGSYKGRSTRALADHCPGTVYAVDVWDGGYKNDDGTQAQWLDTASALTDFRMNLLLHIAGARVIERKGTLADFVDTLPSADMVFLDADHRYEEVLKDIANARRILKPGGLLCGHDYGHKRWPGVKRAVDETFGASCVLGGLCRSIWWGQ